MSVRTEYQREQHDQGSLTCFCLHTIGAWSRLAALYSDPCISGCDSIGTNGGLAFCLRIRQRRQAKRGEGAGLGVILRC